jgi:heme a synthase
VIAGLFICWLLLRSVPRPKERKLAIGVLLLLTLQCILGIADVMLLAPLWLQITHLFVADLLWIALVVLAAKVCVVPKLELSREGTAGNGPRRNPPSAVPAGLNHV